MGKDWEVFSQENMGRMCKISLSDTKSYHKLYRVTVRTML
jgi:hypothetical protein